MASKRGKDSAKRAKRSTSNVFAMFEQNQIQEYKEAFQMMDSNKDGFLDKEDLRATFDSLGRLASEKDLDEMIAEAPGPINFTMFLMIFGDRISGSDPEDVILNAFKTFDLAECGKIEEKTVRAALCKWGEKLTTEECDEVFAEASVDSEGMIDYVKFTRLLTRGKEDDAGAA